MYEYFIIHIHLRTYTTWRVCTRARREGRQMMNVNEAYYALEVE